MARFVREVIRGEPPLLPPIDVGQVLPQVAKKLASQNSTTFNRWLNQDNKPAQPSNAVDRHLKWVLRKDFYQSDEWRAVRYEALKLHSARCQCCGRSARDGIVIHVDHIKPRSRFPELALTLDNLQILCEDCNLGKMARDETDWRPSPADRTDVLLAKAK